MGDTLRDFLFLCVLLSGFFLAKTPHTEAQERPWFLHNNASYLWPTNASNYLSATFGETRARHFHAAIDIGTWGVEGYEVYAARSGTLFRASVSAVGYGNAVYLQHDDGSFTLYAHLMDFAPEIRALVDSIRFLDYSFQFDELLYEHGVFFEQGDIIGWTGSTGVGPPHLHIEVRSPTNIVYNPLLVGFTIPDRIAPTFRSLSVEPISNKSVVEASKNIHLRNAEVRNRIFDFGEIEAFGPIGLGVNVFDRADGRPNVYAVYELEMTVNGTPYFHSRIDSFSFDDTHQMFLDRVFPVLFETRRGFQRLFVRDGNQLPFYTTNEHRGILDVRDGSYDVRIFARDFFGNESQARVMIHARPPELSPPPQLRINPVDQRLANTEFPHHWNWHQNWVHIPNVAGNAKVSFPGSRHQPKQVFTGSEATISLNHRHPLTIQANEFVVTLHRVFPDSPAVIASGDGRLQVTFQTGSVYDTLSVFVHHSRSSDSSELSDLHVLPNVDPIFRPAQIRFSLDEQHQKKQGLGIYFPIPNRDRWQLADGNKRKENYLEAEITHFASFRIKQDTLAPQIRNPRIYRRSDGKWFASVTVTDNLSGIDFETAEFYINGIRGIAEFDPEKNLIIYHHPTFVPGNEHILQISVADFMGNTAREEFRLGRP